jgi:acetyl-CoA synthetase
VERANVTRLMRAHGIATEVELIERSTSDVEWFWDAAIRDLGLEFFEPYSSILDTTRGIEWATWFGGGSVNLAHNCVDRWAEHTPDATAIAWEGEEGTTRRVSYRELREESDRLANGLAGLGVRPLDAVGIFLPPTPGGSGGRDGVLETRRGVAAPVLGVRRRRDREAAGGRRRPRS